jgi:hypothetical protein
VRGKTDKRGAGRFCLKSRHGTIASWRAPIAIEFSLDAYPLVKESLYGGFVAADGFMPNGVLGDTIG